MADGPLDRRIADRREETNRSPGPPPAVDRPAPWEEPSGVIERLITSDRRRDVESRPEVPRSSKPDVVALLREIGAQSEADKPKSPERAREVDLGTTRPNEHDEYSKYGPHPMAPTLYAEGLREHPDGARPLKDGPPRRDQVEQGRLGDCGVMATLGAVAAHRPEAIERCVRETDDGGYEVELHHVEWQSDDLCVPTGDAVRMKVPSEVPVFSSKPDRPAFAQAPEAAWPAVLEKGLAGCDQAWTAPQAEKWETRWDRTRAIRNAKQAERGEPLLPDGPAPTGYARLNQGTNAWDRAEILTQITGERAEVRHFPDGPEGDKMLAAAFEQQLAGRKPVLVGSRPLDKAAGESHLPHRLYPSHAYEVTKVEDGKVHLHNPWNTRHPDPLTLTEVRECFSRTDQDGQRRGIYTTLQ